MIDVINFISSCAGDDSLLLEFLKFLIDTEINGNGTNISLNLFISSLSLSLSLTLSTEEPETLFRNNDYASKLLSAALNDRGSAYLKSVLAAPIAAICKNPPAVEIDPVKVQPNENAEDNLKNLTHHCTAILKHILDSLPDMPEYIYIPHPSLS